MSTVTLSLPDTLSTFVDQQVAGRGYDTSGDCLIDLIRADQDRQRLRAQLLDGARSPATAPADEAYFRELRERAGRTPTR
ncbi:hypothetical protein ASG52_11200 [Methylobacterium sp. Leaf456]|uniref:ribbon-helix-helix domain-containing protein n=1 Tax=Methylobacterium sp. Leaf456 TaxID=1736382 RepID=UPI0006FB0076|nr:hypothetical protein [Methylobacterium sp. Leaf456]KQT47824.1 hypothetical protein ASG52_11200 [Methylobacterium sp. Leaf456]